MLLKKDITPAPIAIKHRPNTQLVSGFTPLETICRADKYKMSLTGFTLMEVIISAVLIAIVLAGLANLFVVGKRYILHNRSRMTGGELGRVFLDPLQMHVRQDTWGTANNCLSNKTNCPTPQTLDKITYTPDYNDITDVAGTNLRRVRLIISWTEPAP